MMCTECKTYHCKELWQGNCTRMHMMHSEDDKREKVWRLRSSMQMVHTFTVNFDYLQVFYVPLQVLRLLLFLLLVMLVT
jgi:hypothetical protein